MELQLHQWKISTDHSNKQSGKFLHQTHAIAQEQPSGFRIPYLACTFKTNDSPGLGGFGTNSVANKALNLLLHAVNFAEELESAMKQTTCRRRYRFLGIALPLAESVSGCNRGIVLLVKLSVVQD
eukprot:5978775-Amphidinium_carterae.1